MANVQHEALTGADVHEAKGVDSATADQVHVADGAGSGTHKKLEAVSLDGTEGTNGQTVRTNGTTVSWVDQETAWETDLDSTYTSLSKLSISSGVRTKVTIDGLAFSASDGVSAGTMWDTGTNKVVAEGENYAYNIRFDFKCSTTGTNVLIDTEWDVGGAAQVILTRTASVAKGASITNSIVSGTNFFVGADMAANGMEIYLTPSANIDVWDMGIFITRIHKAYT